MNQQIHIDDLEVFKHVIAASLYDQSSWRIVEGPMPSDFNTKNPIQYLKSAFKRSVVQLMRRKGFVLMRPEVFDAEAREKGLDWPFFGYSMVGHKRLDNVQHCVETVLREDIPGDFIETGVWRGGCVMLMKAILDVTEVRNRKVWCADSFEGLPKPNARDLEISAQSDFSDRNFLAVSQEEVEENFRRFGLLDENVKFLKGWFSETLPNAPVTELALARLDGDLYESTMDALENLYPKISDGGFVIVDDYGSWAGCRTAIDEYRDRHGITTPIEMIDSHGCFWRVTRS